MADIPLYPVESMDSAQDIVRRLASADPGRLALVDLAPTPFAHLTRGELHDAVVAFGAALRALGLREGAHIALVSENRAQWCMAWLAVVSFNYVVVPIDRNLKENDIVSIVHGSDAEAVICSEQYREIFLRMRGARRELRLVIDMDLPERRDGVESMPALIAAQRAAVARGDEQVRLPVCDPDRLAVLVFTSGSMGAARGVMLSQRNIASNITAMLQMVRIHAEDRFLSILPIHHAYECTCGQLCPLTAGASVHYARSLRTVADDMRTVRPTVVLGVPLLYDKMHRRIMAGIAEHASTRLAVPAMLALAAPLEHAGMHGIRRRLFSRIHESLGGAVRLLIVGGAAPDPVVSKAFRGFGFTFLQGYGLTETSPILALNRVERFRDDAAGLPLPNVRLRIDDPTPEGHGEICAQAPSVMLGYYRNDTATSEALRDGWFHTGDIGRIDDEGFLHIVGRKKNVIIARNGKNVYPEELEEKLSRIPWVLECVVSGARNDRGDEDIVATVVPNADALYEHARKTKREVTPEWVRECIDTEIRALNRTVPAWKTIRVLRIRDEEFEKTTTQKIKRYAVASGGTTEH